MKWCATLFFTLFLAQISFCQNIDIGIFRSKQVQQIDFSYYNGVYTIYGDSISFGDLRPNEFISVNKSGTKVQLKRGGKLLGTFNTVYFAPTVRNIAMRLNPRQPVMKERIYFDAFKIFAGGQGLAIVNQVSYKHYLEGVLESEGGGGRHVEYYKAQAVISRTYALKHINRHKEDGFNLCDQVHCQAYFNKPKFSNEIIEAVRSTDGVFMIDTLDNELVESYFHSNCGGETSRADYVWNRNISYLQPIEDTFCTKASQAKWTRKIPKWEWKQFLVNNYYYPINDSNYADKIYTFKQRERKAFFVSPRLGIPLRDIRQHFKLKSTFFSCYPEGDYVILVGRGFGHGVGLCQEGAMNMANSGYNYQQILQFYYGGISFKHYFEQVFFSQAPVDIIDF